MQDFDDKDKVFVVSIGRTGTKFFSKVLPEAIPGCYAIHEPDSIKTGGPKAFRSVLRQISERGGFTKLLFLKALGITGARNLSLQRLADKIDRAALLAKFRRERAWTVRIPCSLYVESNQQLYGVSEDLLSLPKARVLHFVRNPLDWIRSCVNMPNGPFGPRDLLTRFDFLGFRRATPRTLGLPGKEWAGYTQVEKLAWFWNRLNSLFADIDRKDYANARFCRFEDFFVRRDEETLRSVMAFIVGRPETPEAALAVLKKRLGTKVHSAFAGDVRARELSADEKATVRRMCGGLMESFGYA